MVADGSKTFGLLYLVLFLAVEVKTPTDINNTTLFCCFKIISSSSYSCKSLHLLGLCADHWMWLLGKSFLGNCLYKTFSEQLSGGTSPDKAHCVSLWHLTRFVALFPKHIIIFRSVFLWSHFFHILLQLCVNSFISKFHSFFFFTSTLDTIDDELIWINLPLTAGAADYYFSPEKQLVIHIMIHHRVPGSEATHSPVSSYLSLSHVRSTHGLMSLCATGQELVWASEE